MKYDEDYSNGHINLFAPNQNECRKPKSILKHTNYRTKNPPNKKDDLSSSKTFDDIKIRGYSSNIYRDDFTALKIESKEYLIPWNGDHSLLIDKYDCRLYLHDLNQYDSDLMPDFVRNAAMTHEESQTETMCDFERYLDLAEDENQIDPDQSDADSKRGAAIGYVYDNNDKTEKTCEPNKQVNKNEKLFNPDENLKLPAGMIYPETVKINQLVMKTANFVAKQGLQAEILLKTKQSGNTQFNFLLHGDQLHPYYKHLISLIQEAKIDPVFYLQQETEIKSSPEPLAESESESDEDNYLHPLLANAINRTPSANSMTQDPIEKVQEEKSSPIEATDTKIEQVIIEKPSGNEKIIIDKLAEYVGRNGVEFEENLRKKNDSRFDFLNLDHKFNKYYKFQVESILQKKMEENVPTSQKRSHKSHRRERRKSDQEATESSDSDSSSSSDKSESDRENEKKSDKKRHKEKKKPKRHRHEKSSSRKRHHQSSRKKHKKRSSS